MLNTRGGLVVDSASTAKRAGESDDGTGEDTADDKDDDDVDEVNDSSSLSLDVLTPSVSSNSSEDVPPHVGDKS